MLDDININQTIVANGQTILYVMIVVCELPSNLLLQRIGAKYWVPCQMIVWGVVATCHAEIKNTAGYYACRVALGISESGFIPGSIYYMSTFYTKSDFATRASFFWIGSYVGKACGGLFAAGLFRLDGHHGFAGWQWLFMVEGVISIFIGIFALIWWPRSTADTRTLIPGFRILSPRQEHILTTRLLIDDPAKARGHRIKISAKDVFQAISAWRMWIIFAFVISLVAPLTCLETYNPQIVRELGFETIQANAMSSVGVWCALPLIVLAGRAASMTGKHGVCAFFFTIPYPIFTGAFMYLQQQPNSSVWARYGVYQSMIAVGSPAYILGVVWTSSNARSPTQRSVFSALYVMFTNTANTFATQIFRENDKPRYLKGLAAVLSLQCAACLFVLLALFVFWLSNEKEFGDAGLPAVKNHVETAGGEASQEVQEVTVAKKFKYSL